ncbi:MAG: CoA-binding protein [Syntrophales bacterium]|jgi:acyl-CoA synthetase (NDP forming)|nr:CoA-binding protein [Syntrophales bacterium]MDY0043703.1 CoA-binding protein [Syntrophales bacterium]
METGDKLFNYIFNPRNVAIIGASPSDLATRAQIKTKIRERLYLVNPKYEEILGHKCYPRISDIKVEIDYVIISVPASLLPQVLEECICKKVKAAQIFTAGFSETGIPERAKQEEELKKMAAGKIRLIGPNCFGVYCPKSGLAIVPESPAEEGHIGVVAQSGSIAESFSFFARTKNLRFSKIISYGNAADLDGSDFLEFLADDTDTHIIAVYIEGTKNGSRLIKALSRAAGKKPVIAIKGGMTSQGMRAAASHTAALAGSPDIWRGIFTQCGVLQVDNFDEMSNTLMAFSTSPLPSGRSTALITNSGGFSVIQTDMCMKAGIKIPPFSRETTEALGKLVPQAGTGIHNPLDAWPIYYNVGPENNISDIIQTVASDRSIHTVVFQFDQFRYFRRILGKDVEVHMKRLLSLMIEGCVKARQKEGKPVMIVISLDPYLEDDEDRCYNLMLKNSFTAAGFPVYPALDAAIKAAANLCRYHENLRHEK